MIAEIYFGRRRILPEKLAERAQANMNEGTIDNVFVVVPDQLTLETEMYLMRKLNLRGSFRLNIVSAKRFCGRVFEDCGKPDSVVIDETGRTMLMSWLLKQNADKLIRYKSSVDRVGFEQALISQITHFKQAGITCEEVKKLIETSDNKALNDKLTDILLIYEQYESVLKDHMQDNEDMMNAAAGRMADAGMLKNARVLIYGFDITTQPLNELFGAICSVCDRTELFLPLPGGEKRDGYIYEPLKDSVSRLFAVLNRRGISYNIHSLTEDTSGCFMHEVTEELYSLPLNEVEGAENAVHAVILKNPLDEALFTAAKIRDFVRTHACRYSDIRVLMPNPENYLDVIDAAFGAYEIPYFTQESRNSATYPLCSFLLETLALIAGKSLNAEAVIESGFADISAEEAEVLLSYCDRLHIMPSAMMRPFTRGLPQEREKAEEIRGKLMNPIVVLRDKLKNAESLSEQLTAMYAYLTDLNCSAKSEAHRAILTELGCGTMVADDVTVNNLLMDTFDQMHSLMGDKKLSAVTIHELLTKALSAKVIKVLPQSPDAVHISAPERSGLMPVQAVYMLNTVIDSDKKSDIVLEEEEVKQITEKAGCYLAPDSIALSRTRKMYIKDALCSAETEIWITYPSSQMNGAPNAAGMLLTELRRCYRNVKINSVETDEETRRVRMQSVYGALSELSEGLNDKENMAAKAEAARRLDRLHLLDNFRRMLSFRTYSEKLDGNLAERLYPDNTSVSRLEKFAGCPFSHFVEFGLRPKEERDFEIDGALRGTFIHECTERFVKLNKELLTDEQTAQARMNELAERILGEEKYVSYVNDSETARAGAVPLKNIAVRASKMLYNQMKKGVFTNAGTEINFSGNEHSPIVRLSNGRKVTLSGKIDRVDTGLHNGKRYAMIVDYKTGKNSVNPSHLYYGIQLQLLVYLGVAQDMFSAGSAGAYYLHLKDKLLRTDSRDPAAISKDKQKEELLMGIAPDDKELLHEIADNPEQVLKISFVQSGDFKKDSQVASEAEFEMLVNHTLGKCEEFVHEIYDGVTDIAPYADNDKDSCRYCRYLSVCQKDKHIPQTVKRSCEKLKFDELKSRLSMENGQ